jgi:hypothetical protein
MMRHESDHPRQTSLSWSEVVRQLQDRVAERERVRARPVPVEHDVRNPRNPRTICPDEFNIRMRP